jgi:ABC-type Fe3+-hydroxamate transport system substrate-binding protein
MKKTILFTMLIVFSLTACSTGGSTSELTPTSAPATEIVVQPTPTIVITEDPPAQVDPTATQMTVQEPEPTATEEPVRVQSLRLCPAIQRVL